MTPSVLAAPDGRPPVPERMDAPDCFHDLNLDQMVDAVDQGREGLGLRSLFHSYALARAQILYRQEVFRDLERAEVSASVAAFVTAMRVTRDHLSRAAQAFHPRQGEWWHLQAVLAYCRAVPALAAGLTDGGVDSRALTAVGAYVRDYAASGEFRALRAAADAITHDLTQVVYAVRVREARITVLPFGGEEDMGERIAGTFARFRVSAAKDYRVDPSDGKDMNHVEAQILDRVAALFPDVFVRLSELMARPSFLEGALVTFDRELQFYLAYLEYTAPIRQLGLSFCYPKIVPSGAGSGWRAAFDLVLARKLAMDGRTAVASDWSAGPGERGFVLTGPNHGGKTTFSRCLGQMHVLASLGCPVPGQAATLGAVDAVYTHYEREERAAESPRSKLEDELIRLRRILDRATGDSLVVLNETLASTTLSDGVSIGRRALDMLWRTGARFLWVTFMEGLARQDRVVSLAAVTGDDFSPTFRVERRAPTGVAHALAVARRHGLDGDAIRRRIAP